MKDVTDRDITDATIALQAWFKSQDIDPGLGITIMLNLISSQIVATTKPDHGVQLAFMAITLAALVKAKKKDHV